MVNKTPVKYALTIRDKEGEGRKRKSINSLRRLNSGKASENDGWKKKWKVIGEKFLSRLNTSITSYK